MIAAEEVNSDTSASAPLTDIPCMTTDHHDSDDCVMAQVGYNAVYLCIQLYSIL